MTNAISVLTVLFIAICGLIESGYTTVLDPSPLATKIVRLKIPESKNEFGVARLGKGSFGLFSDPFSLRNAAIC
jgi:hypothetical protein